MPSITKTRFRRIGFRGNHARQGWVEHHWALCIIATRTPAGANLIAHSVQRCTSIPKAVRALDMMERLVAKTKSLEGSHIVCLQMNQHIHIHRHRHRHNKHWPKNIHRRLNNLKDLAVVHKKSVCSVLEWGLVCQCFHMSALENEFSTNKKLS